MALRQRVVLVLVLLSAVLLVSPLVTAQAPDTVKIASWNIMNLGANPSVGQRARIIAQFDIVALQEIQSKQGLMSLEKEVEKLTRVPWKTVVSRKVGKGGKAEYYAFLYRTDRVETVGGTGKVYPKGGFARPPFYATFRAGDFDFTLITVHTRPAVADKEARRLAKVWDYVQDSDEDEDDLLLMGDFNVDGPERDAFTPLRDDRHLDYLITGEGTKTTYSTKASNFMAKWFDNMWDDPQHTAHEYTGDSDVDIFYHRFFVKYSRQKRLNQVRRISDHCPVYAVFWTNKGDDD